LKLVQTFIECLVFFDKGKLVILINGFQKKTQKTPKKEIEIAEKLKSQYFEALINRNYEQKFKSKINFT